jgi:CRP/FNR family cyclic AMP-dependent transcriptional regulator
MNSIERKLRKHPFTAGMPEAHLTQLSEVAREIKFGGGEVILRQREPANCAYLLASGKVLLLVHSRATHRNVCVDTLGEGDVLGWSWLVAPYCWHLEAVAIEPTTAIVLDGSALLVRCEEDHDFGFELLKRVTRLLVHRIEAMRSAIVQLDVQSAQVPEATGI